MYVVVAAPEQSKQLSVSWAEGAWHGQRGRGMGRGGVAWVWHCQESLLNRRRHSARLVGRRVLEECYRVG
jgi:hypothetical protein